MKRKSAPATVRHETNVMTHDSQSGREVKPRGRPSDEGRFVWLASLAIERIVNRLGITQAAYGIAVYVALCRLSSKQKNNPIIQAQISEIAGLARLGYRKTMEVLHLLSTPEIGVIAIEEKRTAGRKTQEPSIYTLLATRQPNRKSDQTSPQAVRPDFPRRTPSCAEIPKELLPKVVVVEENKAADAASSFAPKGQGPASAPKDPLRRFGDD